jgi:hypothetical protein
MKSSAPRGMMFSKRIHISRGGFWDRDRKKKRIGSARTADEKEESPLNENSITSRLDLSIGATE